MDLKDSIGGKPPAEMTTLLLLSLAAGLGWDLKFVSTGMTSKMGGYMPIRAEMKPLESGVGAGLALKAPVTGSFVLGDKTYPFILDDEAKLYVDGNANGNWTDDKAPTWEKQVRGTSYMLNGSAEVMINGTWATVKCYRFDKNDPARAQLKDTLLYYADFGYEGKGKFGSNTFTVGFAGPIDAKARIWVDRNGNGKSDGRSESISAAAPFNFGGVTYELKIAGNSFEAVKSDKEVAEIPLPPDFTVGKPAMKFEAVATDGTKISFPGTFKGKVVMLDFWATWCGPCIAELPNLTKAYEKYKDKGFEVLGISFDKEDWSEKLATFTKEHNMPWRQVYEGKFWDTTIGRMYGVEGIPFAVLVDGTTGNILANVSELRGERLEKTLSNVFSSRG